MRVVSPVNRVRQWGLAALLLGGCAVPILVAQQPSEAWKQSNARDGRFEGIGADKPVAAPGLVLVGFAERPRQAFDGPIRDAYLSVDFYAPRDGQFSIVAREVGLKEAYLFQPRKPAYAKQGPVRYNQVWSTDYLRSIEPRVPLSRLGVVVTLESHAAHELVAPATLRYADAPAQTTASEYEFTFRSAINLDAVTYQLIPGCGDGSAEKRPLGRQRAEIPFSIKAALNALPSGYATLRVDYTPEGKKEDDAVKALYCYWHGPAPSSGG